MTKKEVTGQQIITLRTPSMVAGVKVSQLVMREPSFDDNAVLEKIESPIQRERQLFANLCGISPEEVGQLTLHDSKKLAKAFDDFL